MNTAIIKVEAFEITGGDRLDPVQVYWYDIGSSRGHVTITCFGAAWTAYFNGMGFDALGGPVTIREFFAKADVGYLIDNLHANPLSVSKRDLTYLRRIVSTVKAALEEMP